MYSPDGFHLLMNLPVESDVNPLVEMVQPLLRGQTVSLPPVRVPPRPQQLQQQSQPPLLAAPGHSSPGMVQQYAGPSFAAPALDAFQRFSLTSVTETLASKTQRLYKELERIGGEKSNDLSAVRSYDDAAWHQQPLQSPANDSVPFDRRRPTVSSPGGDGALSRITRGFPSADNPPSHDPSRQNGAISSSPHRWGREMGLRLAVLQDFVMTLERGGLPVDGGGNQTKAVPNAVWEALADLEVLRQDIVRHTSANETNNGGNRTDHFV